MYTGHIRTWNEPAVPPKGLLEQVEIYSLDQLKMYCQTGGDWTWLQNSVALDSML